MLIIANYTISDTITHDELGKTKHEIIIFVIIIEIIVIIIGKSSAFIYPAQAVGASV